ncbi:hypothetical protein SK128_027492 [Halocaridina rubra]|uniref:Uncharacterized protein n=1 Tax=Halocaridina rubra TaxID=373956 RepID=A0AAN9ACT2_HALRR
MDFANNSSSINTTDTDTEATNAIEADGFLDDKLLDAMTPITAILDEVEVEETLRPAFCTRCRTISSSFLSSPYVGSGDSASLNEERAISRSLPSSRLIRDHMIPYNDSNVVSDDVPLLRVRTFIVTFLQ